MGNRVVSKEEIRREAIERLRQRRPGEWSSLPPADLDAMLHEMEVYQAELEVQNEELRRTELELTRVRDNYRDLYEFAPVGYVTLDARGVIMQANLTAVGFCC